MFGWFKKRKNIVSQYHDARLDLDAYEQAIANLNSLTDSSLTKRHNLILKVKRLEKAAKEEVKVI